MRRTRSCRQRKGKKAADARKCDKFWSELVRSRGACEMDGSHGGPLQAAHGFSRRYRGTRWLLINGFCLCAGHHVSMTNDPIAWDDYLRRAWGSEVYPELRRLAQAISKPDFESILADLEAHRDREVL